MQHSDKTNDLGKRLFTFAVIADTHLNKDECVCNSPFPVNRLSNGRMRYVVRDINTRDIDFVMHLGDLIHPVPAVKDLYLGAAARFHNQVAELKVPIHVVPGNHDVGDKPMPWAPAGSITDEYLNLWESTFGAHYYAFDHKDCHFIVINSELMNSGLPAEQEQKTWLRQDLAANKGRRIFVHTHYPPFLCETDEAEHYDNIAEPERSWLLELIGDNAVEGLFAGHVHNFWYLRFRETDCYLLPSTSFVRQDYSEMFKAPPTCMEYEWGRNDSPKLGYFLVHVHENAHVCEMVRTNGEIVEPDAPKVACAPKVPPVSPRENRHPVLGFDLRQSWAEKIGIPPSGGLDEFDRKEVRNDYPLLALWEMGVRQLRVPLQDLRNESGRRRMRDIQRMGHEFTMYSFNLPGTADLALIKENRDLLKAWEIGFHWNMFEAMADSFARLAAETGVPIYLDRMWEHAENISPDGRYYHVINHGFRHTDREQIQAVLSCGAIREAGVGLVFRVTKQDDPYAVIRLAGGLYEKHALPVHAHLRMAGYNPAEITRDDEWAATRLAVSMMTAAANPGVAVFSDTLTDVDRGYFPRHGVLDATANPRWTARLIQNLHALLGAAATIDAGGRTETAEGAWFWNYLDGKELGLYLPKVSTAHNVVVPWEAFGGESKVQVVNLDTGTTTAMDGRRLLYQGVTPLAFLQQ